MDAQDLCQRRNGSLFKAEARLDSKFICWQGGVVYFIAGILFNLIIHKISGLRKSDEGADTI